MPGYHDFGVLDLLITQISAIVGTAFAQPDFQELAVSFLQEADDERWNWG
jgi:hypothetical protein